MKRRTLLIGLSTILAGCAGGETVEDSSPTPTDEPTATPEATNTETSGPTATESPTETGAPTATESEVAFRIRIEYSGEWSGSIAAGGDSFSIDGEGSETREVTGDPSYASVSIQKQDDSEEELVVQILQDGSVISEANTTSSYGVASTSSLDSGGGNSGETSTPSSSYAVKVIYEGEWSGSINSGGSSRSVDGSGTREIEIDGAPSVISVTAQKQDDSSRKLTVQILKDGDVVTESSTTASYGVVTTSETFF